MTNLLIAGLRLPVMTADPSSPSEGDIYYQSTLDVIRVYTGAAWVTLASSTPTQVAFSAYKSASTTSVVGWQKVICNTEHYDTNSLYDPTLGRFSPPEGYYRLAGTVYHFPGQTNMATAIYKNGTLWKVLQAQDAGGTDFCMPGGACNAYSSGTDYFELWFYSSAAVASGITGGAAYTHFSGDRI